MKPSACLLRSGSIVGYASESLIVEISAQNNCEQCAQGRGCGLGLLARRRAQRVMVDVPRDVTPADDKSGAVEEVKRRYPMGSSVTISLPRASITLLAFCIYALPLFCALLLSGLSMLVSNAVWMAPLIFFAALVTGAISVKYLLRGQSERFRPCLVC